MTVIVYHNDTLVSDSLGIFDMGTDAEIHFPMQKIFYFEVKGKKVMAMAKPGEVIDPTMLMPVVTILFDACREMESRTDMTRRPIPKTLIEVFGKILLQGIVLMTKRGVYRVTEEEIYQTRENCSIFIGAGVTIAKVAVHVFGATAIEAVEKACEISPVCGGELQICHRKDLVAIQKIKISDKVNA